jgi:hypothetical protein
VWAAPGRCELDSTCADELSSTRASLEISIASQEVHGIEVLVERRVTQCFHYGENPCRACWYFVLCMFELNVYDVRWY